MNIEWHRLCCAKGFTVDGEAIDIQLADERKHRVYVSIHDEEYLLRGVIARSSFVKSLDNPIFATWKRNRNSELVGFRIDDKGRIVGESWVPKAGLTADEFQLYVRTVAVECDRLEGILSVKDAY